MARSLRIGLVAGLASIIIAVIAFAQTVAFPVAPPGTPAGYVPVTANTLGQTIWVPPAFAADGGVVTLAGQVTGASNANVITPGTSAQVLMSNATPATTWASFTQDVTVSATGVSTVNSINGSAPVNVVNGALSFSTNAAATGNLRAPNNTTIVAARNAANSADLGILKTDSSNDVFLNSGGAPVFVSVNGNNSAEFGQVSGDFLNLGAAGTQLQLTPTSVAIGANAATTGNVRAPNNTTIVAARNAANSANISLLSTDGSNDTLLNAGAVLYLETGGTAYVAVNGPTLQFYNGSNLGDSTYGAGNAFIGNGGALGYTEFAAATGAHNTQDALSVCWNDSEHMTTYSAKNFNVYPLGGGSLTTAHGLSYTCTITGRVVTAGTGTGCTFWATGAHGTPDTTFACTVRATGQLHGGVWSAYAAPYYIVCDVTGSTNPSTGTGPTNPVFTFSATTSTSPNEVTVQWAPFNDVCGTSAPVIDAQSRCCVEDD